MTKLLTFKLGMRFQHLRQGLLRSRQLELQRPGDQLVSGWTIVEDRVVPGIFPPLSLVSRLKAGPQGSDNGDSVGVWVSALPRSTSNNTRKHHRNMLGCTLGLHQCNVSAASVESSLWIVDNRGRVKYGNYQSQQSSSSSPGTRLEYAWVRHPLPHDVRSAPPLVTGHYHRDLIRNDSWLVVAHSARLGVTNNQRPLEVLLNNLEDSTQFLDTSDYSQAEDPSLEMTLHTRTSDTLTRNVDFVQI